MTMLFKIPSKATKEKTFKMAHHNTVSTAIFLFSFENAFHINCYWHLRLFIPNKQQIYLYLPWVYYHNNEVCLKITCAMSVLMYRNQFRKFIVGMRMMCVIFSLNFQLKSIWKPSSKQLFIAASLTKSVDWMGARPIVNEKKTNSKKKRKSKSISFCHF